MVYALDMDRCLEIIKEQNNLMGSPVIVPEDFDSIDFPIVGTAVIYAVREYLLTNKFWEHTILSRAGFDIPTTPAPKRWFDMAYMESNYRVSSRGCDHIELNPVMMQDLISIVRTFSMVFGKPNQYLDTPCHMNPNFTYSCMVGGADANMIIGNTLWDIRTTLKRRPFTLDDIVQQVAYVLLDGDVEYHIQQITWYYSRQLKTFTYPVTTFLKEGMADELEGFIAAIDEGDSPSFSLALLSDSIL